MENLIEVKLSSPDDFLILKESLQRIGISSFIEGRNTLIQTCHILHKRGRYFIVHFKEIFALDGRHSTLSEEDIARRNTIAKLCEQWNLCKILNPQIILECAPMSSIKIVSHADRRSGKWDFVSKHALGKRHF